MTGLNLVSGSGRCRIGTDISTEIPGQFDISHSPKMGRPAEKFPNSTRMTARRFLTYSFAAVWLVNGLFCKVLDLVPRHREIVGRILGEADAQLLTQLIGFAEIGMAIWILSGIARRINAVVQIAAIAVMNILEFILVPDLLLWGRANAIIALLFILLIAYTGLVRSD